jgi:hypothetical protein
LVRNFLLFDGLFESLIYNFKKVGIS